MEPSSFKYRPDIDGLRALAVLGVVLFHSSNVFPSGGFVGVDVFFVISGYLITGILHREQCEGRFSLLAFYERRIRRIMPALFVVLAGTLAAAGAAFMALELLELGKSLEYSVLSGANLYFRKAADDYFNAPVDGMPLLHLWSLGVEEQFYLILPLLLLAIRRWGRSEGLRLGFLGVLASASLVASAVMVHRDTSACFYLLPYRAWELMLGALLALCPLPTVSLKASHVQGAVGLLLIVGSMLFFTRSVPFPGLLALLPCGGTALVIAAGRDERCWSSRVLSAKPLVFIGLISYSVYLWHWPLIVFSQPQLGNHPSFWPLLPLLSILAGLVSWRCVEKPFRDRSKVSTRSLVAGWAVITIAFLGVARYVRSTQGFIRPPPPEVVKILDYQTERNPCKKQAFDEAIPPNRPYVYGDRSSPARFALWGDSHANTIAYVMGNVAGKHNESFKFYGRSGVVPLLGVYNSKFGGPAQGEQEYTEGAFADIVADANIHTVILYARWMLMLKGRDLKGREAGNLWVPNGAKTDEDREAYFRACLLNTVRRLIAADKKVVILYSTPEIEIKVPQIVASKYLHPERPLELPDEQAFYRRQRVVFKMFDELSPDPHLVRLRPYTYFLQKGAIVYAEGNVPLFFDGNHLSQAGALRLTPMFDRVFAGTAEDEGTTPSKPD